MKENLKISIFINANIEQVWAGLTDPIIVKQYFFGTNLVTTWKIGSPIYFRGEWQGKSYEDKGEIVAYNQGHHVTYSYWSSMSATPDKPENYQLISYDLLEKDGGTELILTQETSPEKKEHSTENWKMIFNGLKKLLEKSR